MIKRLITKTVIYLLVGFVFFLEMVNFVKFPIVSNANDTTYDINTMEQNITNQLVSLEKTMDNQINQELYDKFDIDSNKSYSNRGQSFDKLLMEKYIFFDYTLNNNNSVIPVIYLLTLVAFLLQVTLFAWSSYYSELLGYYSEKRLDTLFLYGSEWAINAPPVLGVIGTIFSFGMVVGNLADMSSLSTVFKDNFPNAALTTILGGSVYVINLYLNIFIAKNLATK